MTNIVGTLFPPATRMRARGKFRLPVTSGLVLLILAVAMPFVAFINIGLNKAQKNVMDRLVFKSGTIIHDLETNIRTHLNPVKAQSGGLARFLAKNEDTLNDPKKFQRLISGALSGLPQVREIDFIDPRGMVYRLNKNSERLKVSNWSENPEVQRLLSNARKGFEPNWANFFFAESTERSLMNFHQPLMINGRFAGVLVSVVSYQSLSDAIVEPNNPQQRNAFILYGPRHVIAHRNLGSINVDLSDNQPLPTIKQIMDPVLGGYFGKLRRNTQSFGDAMHTVVEVSGAQYFLVHKNVTGFGKEPWLAGTYLPLSVLDTELDQIKQFRVYGLIISILALAAAYFLSSRIVRPIGELASAARHIHEKGFVTRGENDIKGSFFRELDDAASAFNVMRQGLGRLDAYVPEGVTDKLLEEGGQAIEAEQREVTVLFTDIIGFTRTSTELQAAQVANLLNVLFSLLADCVRAENGTIDKYIGDSMMAFWSEQDDQSDHAERAFRAALEMASRLRRLNKSRREEGLDPIRLRIGLHTGPVVVGNIGAPGRYNFTLIGDTVNVAERVERLSKEHIREDQDAIVFVTKQTLDCIGQDTKEFSIGSHLLRGRGEPIEIFCFA